MEQQRESTPPAREPWSPPTLSRIPAGDTSNVFSGSRSDAFTSFARS